MNHERDIFEFADYWLHHYTDGKAFETEFGDACTNMEFNLEDGEAFSERMGREAYWESEALKQAISGCTDAHMLGSAILYKWRHITHWLEQNLLSDENRAWFHVAFSRLRELGMERHR